MVSFIRETVNHVDVKQLGPQSPRTYRAKGEIRVLSKARAFDGARPPQPYEASWNEIGDLSVSWLPNGNPRGPSPDCWNSQGGSSTFNTHFSAAFQQTLINEAYQKMVGLVQGERAQLGASLAEGAQSLDMIVNRSSQLLTAYRQLRRGRFDLMLSTLGLRRALPKHHGLKWSRPKDASGLWLEYWFGWAPLISDIGTAIEVLQDPAPKFERHHRARARRKSKYSFRQTGRDPVVIASGPMEFGCTYSLVSRVKAPNPNLANRLGFTNPVGIAWELVPFSFMVDWFYPVGKFLNQADDFLGIERLRPFYTVYGKMVIESSMSTGEGSTFTNEGVRVTRHLGNPSFLPQPIWQRLSYTRAATSIALLIGVFSGRLR